MDYEKAYKSLIEELSQARNDERKGYTFCSVIDNIVPELKESEKDERIRKWLIDMVSYGTWRKGWPFGPNEVVAYLEKQKEQKPAEMDNEEIELSDFESELFSAFSDGWQQYLHGEEVDMAQWAKEHSAQLLNAAKQELKKK